MSNVRQRKREELSQVQSIARALLQPERATPICTTCSLLTSEVLAGKSVLHRTATLLPAHSLALRTMRA